MAKKPSKGKAGDWSKVSSDQWSVRAKRGILRGDPPDTYTVKKSSKKKGN